MGNYGARWEVIDNGVVALVASGVIFASIVGKNERPDWDLPDDIDQLWWTRAVDTAKMRRAKGKSEAYLLLRHNGISQIKPEAGLKGELRNIDFVAPFAYADVVVTDPDEIAAVIRGERKNISMEADYERYFVWGLSMVDGAEGHFSEEIPEFTVHGVSLDDEQFKSAVGFRAPSGGVELGLVMAAANVRKNKRNSKMSDSTTPPVAVQAQTASLSVEKPDDAKEQLAEAVRAIELERAKNEIRHLLSHRVLRDSESERINAAKSLSELATIAKELAKTPEAEPRKDFAKPNKTAGSSATAEATEFIAGVCAGDIGKRFHAVKKLRAEKPELYDEWMSEANGGRKYVDQFSKALSEL